MGIDEQKIPQEIPGQDEPGDLMDCVLCRGHSMSGVKGSEPLSAGGLTTVQHEHKAFGLWGQSHVDVTPSVLNPSHVQKIG